MSSDKVDQLIQEISRQTLDTLTVVGRSTDGSLFMTSTSPIFASMVHDFSSAIFQLHVQENMMINEAKGNTSE